MLGLGPTRGGYGYRDIERYSGQVLNELKIREVEYE